MATNTTLAKLSRLYAALLLVYPSFYLQQYGADMQATFADLMEEAEEKQGWLGAYALLLASVPDIVFQGIKERLFTRSTKGGAMTASVQSNPVRGFKTLFWLTASFIFLISFVHDFPAQGYVVNGTLIAFLIALVPLLIRSDRKWWFALFSIVFCLVLSLYFVKLEEHTIAQSPLMFLNRGILNVPFSSDIMLVFDNLLYSFTFLGIAYLVIKEIERPRLNKIWHHGSNMLSIDTKAKKDTLFKVYLFFVLLLLVIVGFIYWLNLNIHIIFSDLSLHYGSAMYELTFFNQDLYTGFAGNAILACGLLILFLTILVAWGLTGKKIGKTIVISFICFGMFLGMNTIASSIVLPKRDQREVVYDQGVVVQKSCAVYAMEPYGVSLQTTWSQWNLPGSPDASVTDTICKYYTNRREGDFLYSGDWSYDGQHFTLTGVRLPLLARFSDSVFFLLLCNWILLFVLPSMSTMLVLLILREKSVHHN